MRIAFCFALALWGAATAVGQTPLVKKNQAEKGYSLKPPAAKTPVWSDKAYAITLVPPSLKGTQMLVRPAGSGRDWPDARDYTATADCIAYLVVRSEYNGTAEFADAKTKQLVAAGWAEVDESFRVNPGKDENWKWRIFKKDVPAGKVDLRVEGLKLEAMTIFFFGKKSAPK